MARSPHLHCPPSTHAYSVPAAWVILTFLKHVRPGLLTYHVDPSSEAFAQLFLVESSHSKKKHAPSVLPSIDFTSILILTISHPMRFVFHIYYLSPAAETLSLWRAGFASVSIYTCLLDEWWNTFSSALGQAQSQRNGSCLVLVSLFEGEASKISTESLVQMPVLSMVTMENSVSNMWWPGGAESSL